MGRWVGAAVAALVVVAVGAPGAQAAAKACGEPGATWERATPAEAGMDAAGLQGAIDHAGGSLAFATRIYRNGCLVAADRNASATSRAQYESWSMAKSITSLVFGRAMTLGLVSPDDPVGALLPEADRAHGAVTLRDLLTMTSGLRWNGLRDYDIAMPDRLGDALRTPIVHEPGTYYEYSQSGPALLANAVERAVGEDLQAFAQRELFGPLGIKATDWRWTRDSKGQEQGFFGMNMRPDDYGRLGELLRRGGVWRGRRLLSTRYVRESTAPSATNGCYGWMHWVNGGKPCIGPRITDRPKSPTRDFPGLPSDMFRFSGLLGQLVTVFPSQGIVVVRNGIDTFVDFTGGGGWELGLYERVLGSLRDGTPVESPGDAAQASRIEERPGEDVGFQKAVLELDQVTAPFLSGALPAAGPQRARALRLRLASPSASRAGRVALRATCPERWPGGARRCVGAVALDGAPARASYDLAPGETQVLRLRLGSAALRSLRAARSRTLGASAVNRDAADGVRSEVALVVKAPPKPRRPDHQRGA
ncbi:serine hydrolase [Conexibacter sp. SYSU D00693]|uniref:serine hydrolase domain-containing protein n=1 Tax=Conexibacter sp. SYSU D00693 TaxID=2812560 RepID=UPI00196AB54B|nr:serine hydrolase [Conexibacter sp. SYSU D00693]